MQEGATKLKETIRISRHTQEVGVEGDVCGTAYRPIPQPVVVQTTQQQSQRGDDKKALAARDKGDASTTLEWVKTVAAGGALVLSIGAFLWSVHTFEIQEKRLQSQLQLQQDSLKQQRDMDSFKRLVELLPKIGCAADP